MAESGVTVDDAATLRAFKSLHLKVSDLSDAFHDIGEDIKNDAVNLVPTLTGTLASTIRNSKAKTRATVSAGYAKVPYAGVQNYGWPNHNISAKYFMNDALDENADSGKARLIAEMSKKIREVGLNP